MWEYTDKYKILYQPKKCCENYPMPMWLLRLVVLCARCSDLYLKLEAM
jgi:hypothetical protein